MLVKLKHSAGFTLPPAPATKKEPNAVFGSGQHLAPGLNEVDADYFAAIKGSPTVLAWLADGKLELVEAPADAPAIEADVDSESAPKGRRGGK